MKSARFNILRKGLASVVLLVFPSLIANRFLRALGYSIHSKARVGYSLLLCDEMELQAGGRIGHFNLIRCTSLTLHKNARIGHLNFMHGPVRISLKDRAAIGNRNVVARAGAGVTLGTAELRLGELSKITASHSVDCTASVTFGNFSILAGKGSQIWTHGYVHDTEGPGRYRVDGPVTLGNNVYIGSGAIITGGVTIRDSISVGAGVTVARDLDESGFYVSSPIRMLPRPPAPETRLDMRRIDSADIVETVYIKK